MSGSAWKALVWIALSELFALSLWFSASVTAPELIKAWDAGIGIEAWLSAAVPMGFVIGALASSYFGLADRYNSRKIFSVAALLGATVNLMIIFSESAWTGITLRIATGITLAGVYPTAVKMLSQWFPRRRGLAIGILIAALTLGSSTPHFIVIFSSSLNWQAVIVSSSLLAVLAACIIYFLLEDNEMSGKTSSFAISFINRVRSNRPVMLANYGYFGHMWELYAMWTWLPVFIAAAIDQQGVVLPSWSVAIISFISIGVAGAIGSIAGGMIADKIGRAQLTILSMAISAACAVGIGFTYGHALWMTAAVSFIWGIFVISDSAQFSAAVTEFADSEYVGTALTFQMCIGFLITIVSINLVPFLEAYMGWKWVFSVLAAGPIFGLVSMVKFKRYES
ncbi:MFS transporter [Bacillus sp. AK031]